MAYSGSLDNIHRIEALLPFFCEWVLLTNVPTSVWLEMEASWIPLHAVPGLLTAQEYRRVSSGEGGAPTEGPPEGAKSWVTCSLIKPLPPTVPVRMK